MKSLLLQASLLLFTHAALANGSLCSHVFSEGHAPLVRVTTEPQNLVATMLADTVQRIDHRVIEPSPFLNQDRTSLHLRAKRNPVVKFLYENKLIDASELSFRMQDKLMLYKLLQHYLGDTQARAIHPHTVGVKEYLFSRGLVDNNGQVNVSKEDLMRVLNQDFPQGFIVKPTVGQNSNGKGFYFNSAEIVEVLLKNDMNGIYASAEKNLATAVEGKVITGERYIIQERLNVDSGSVINSSNEFRVHSYQDKVIDGATFSRWKMLAGDNGLAQIDAMVQSILSALPTQLTARQAWSFDVFRDAQGKMVLVEINTNKGKEGNWSGFVKSPKVLGAYIRHFEKNFNWHLKGLSGILLRNNLGNVDHALKFVVEKYWNTYVRSYLIYLKKISPFTKDQVPNDVPGGSEQ